MSGSERNSFSWNCLVLFFASISRVGRKQTKVKQRQQQQQHIAEKRNTRTKGEKIDGVHKKKEESNEQQRRRDREGDQLTYRCLHCETWLMILHVPYKNTQQQTQYVSITNLLIAFIPWNLHRKCAYVFSISFLLLLLLHFGSHVRNLCEHRSRVLHKRTRIYVRILGSNGEKRKSEILPKWRTTHNVCSYCVCARDPLVMT